MSGPAYGPSSARAYVRETTRVDVAPAMLMDHGMNRLVLRSALLVLVTAAGCAGGADSASPGNGGSGGGVSFGGQQDIGEFRGILEAGGIPGPDTLDANGFFNEHYAPPPETGCTRPICLTPGVSVGRDWLTGAHQATLQIAVSTNIDPATLTRKPLNLVVVVDRSGSMWEDDRIGKVRTGLRTLVDNLRDEDRLALVQFDDRVDVLAPFGETLDRPRLRSLIDSLTPRGATNIHDGLQRGFELASAAFADDRQNRVIFLSDGLATAGITSASTIIAMADGYVERGIGLTTIGVGLSFDVKLMRGLAEHGSGNFYFLEDAAAATEVFEQELDYFVTPLALDVRLEATSGGGWLLGEAVGSTLWSGTSTAGSMKIPAVFVASRTSQGHDPDTGGRRGGGSMIFINLTPTGHNVDGKVADLRLTYRLPGTSEQITEAITLAYPHDPGETPADTYLSTPEMAERYAMYNTFLGLRFATRTSPDCAAAALQATRSAAHAWNQLHEDPDIAADIQLIDMYLANLRAYHTVAETSLTTCGADYPYGDDAYWGHDHGHYHGCSTGKPVHALPLVLALFGLRRRRFGN
jgi:Ca-activated chloride channel homolog